MDTSSTGTAGLFVVLLVVYAVIIIAILAFTVWTYWRIFEKAGYSGALSLLGLIPGGALICMIVLAFGRWPIQDQLDALRGVNATRTTPGSSVMPAP